MSYNIYFLDLVNNAWIESCAIGNNIVIHKSTDNSMRSLLVKICGSIIDWESSKIDLNRDNMGKVIAGNMEFIPLGQIQYRLGSIYYGVQYSHKTKVLEVIIYGTDQYSTKSSNIHPINQPISEIKRYIKDELGLICSSCTDNLDASPEIKTLLKTKSYSL
jgi:hypothetical protein